MSFMDLTSYYLLVTTYPSGLTSLALGIESDVKYMVSSPYNSRVYSEIRNESSICGENYRMLSLAVL